MAKLLDDVAQYLATRDVLAALIGAAAVAFHGVSRSTMDEDLLTVDRRTLKRDFWASFAPDADVEVRVGDYDDPLAGVVRIRRAGETVDVVVGRLRFEGDAVERAQPATVGGVSLRVVGPADLILLKLNAGGPRDAWDVTALLSIVDSAIIAEVESRLPSLPADARELWTRIRASS